MKTSKPIKRDKSLQPLSREHHHSLLLCWKIRSSFRKRVEVKRIKKYADWFFENHIKPHFKIEEKHVFPVLGDEHELVKKALAEHRRLTRLFENDEEVEKSLNRIEEELEAHIRFEERVLFNEIQNVASEEQLKLIDKHHSETKFQENTEDEFWK
ncbi:hemerythrin-like domain-containing protein [Catalinimonas alkaloidigena]|uniref:hemerythrin domain-containing protein n=1 Tax=Catalinimonas alkaloidigena TaxID=1075417 RepID=UPI00240652F1|nr:hemerythrin domain-containing protein [Catalinimonas alkaloidigena]MDF9801361.1 hemerythrin-like domain-containing protein [Catalinimonas alkaloidigena]